MTDRNIDQDRNRNHNNPSFMDRLGLGCLGLLLLSPLVFKVSLGGEIIVHPFTPLLLVAWGWTLWAALDAALHKHGAMPVEWNILTSPVLLMGLVVIGLGCSLAINSLQSGSWQPGGWLLLVKWILYLAPLPFTALLVIRTGSRVMRVLNVVIPPVALLTVVYSFIRFMRDPGIAFMNATSEVEPRYYVMGMFGEVFSNGGLVLRTDTVSQGAYGMYLALALLFSIALALLKGMDGGLPRWYRRGQALLLCPAAMLGILHTGSRTTLLLLCGAVLSFVLLVFWRRTCVLSGPHTARFVLSLLVVTGAGSWFMKQYGPVSFPTLHRLEDTADGGFRLQQSALGTFSPLTNEPRKAALRNVESRVWLWGKTVRYLTEHPIVLLTGIGNDRKRFVEEVIGLSYEGDHVHFQTAHNLFLDVLIKGGLINLTILVIGCTWFLVLSLKAVRIARLTMQSRGLASIGLILLSFWPPFMFVNLMGEEMFTDNLQLHWTILFGLLVGLLSISANMSKAPQAEQNRLN